MLQVQEQRLSCSPWRRPWWRRYFPAAHGAEHSGGLIHTAAHGGSHASAGGYFMKELQRTERTHIGEGENCEDEGLAERTTTPIPYLPVLIRVVGWVVKSRMKGVRWSLEKRGG